MMTPYRREKLALTDLPSDTEILQCLRLSADDASCLNLNKVSTPTVLGVDMKTLTTSDFQIVKNIYSLHGKEIFERLQTPVSQRIDNEQISIEAVYPALVDETVLMWSLGMKLGDTLFYKNDKGHPVAILLAGTLSNTIFQGNILIDRGLFSDIWGETAGSEVFLLKTGEAEKENVKLLLSQVLHEYGVQVMSTNDRLKQFNTVTDAYLTIFMTLGSLGLLLGIMSFIIVIRKNLAARHWEIELYRTLGFSTAMIERTLFRENLIIPLYALATGVISSIAGVSQNLMNVGIGVWLMALLFTIFLLACLIIFVKKSVQSEL
jgi:putative ABC transport system permease protein